MKKLISMVLTAAMVASLVPATAFAGDDIKATAKVVNAWTVKDEDVKAAADRVVADGHAAKDYAPELVIEITDAAVQGTNNTTQVTFTVTLDGATFSAADIAAINAAYDTDNDGTVDSGVYNEDGTAEGGVVEATAGATAEELILTVTTGARFAKGEYITMDLNSTLKKAKDAYVCVESDDFTISNDGVDMIYVDVAKEGMTVETKKMTLVAEEEKTFLERDIEIKSTVGKFEIGQVIQLKLSNGFEFANFDESGTAPDGTSVSCTGFNVINTSVDEDYAEIEVTANVDKLIINKYCMEIEAVDAKAGAVATLTVKATTKDSSDNLVAKAFAASAKGEIAEVVDYKVVLSVDEDEDVPVIYSGVNVDNYGITDDSDHWSLEVTAEETFPGAWSMRKGFEFTLPEGVYVTDVDVTNAENFWQVVGGSDLAAAEPEWEEAFWDAYQEGDHVTFDFAKRTFNDVDTDLYLDCATVTFQMQLVADPGFVGDVELTLKGDLVDEQTVTIATFATPFYVTASQNDLKIDYRYTPVPTEIVVTEAEAGLWDAGKAEFVFQVDNGLRIQFEGDPTFTVNEESGLALDDAEANNGWIQFTVDEESDEEPAVVTISDMELFLDRTIPAGPYDLDMGTAMGAYYVTEVLFAPDYEGNAWKQRTDYADDTDALKTWWDGDYLWTTGDDDHGTAISGTKIGDSYVDDVADFETVVHEAFVNIVTAGREQDDNSFTTIVQVPVGELYLVAGENTVELDVPAYINANGYTMLPVRAVAKALGINNNNVLWDQATKTVTILYGQRIITMQVGASVIYVNGSAIPAASSVEIVDGRTFLGLRDLATALGVTTIDWDPASKTALLNAEFEA